MGRAVIVATKPKRLKSEPKPFRPETSGRGVMASFARNRFLLSRSYSAVAAKSKLAKQSPPFEPAPAAAMVKEGEEVLAPVIGRPLSDILRELNKKVPESLIRTRTEDGFNMRYIPWHFVNRILNLHAPEWSGEVRSIVYSADGKSVSVVYRVTLYGTDAEVHREATGTASTMDTDFGDPLQKAEAMAFRRACARLGLGLYLYHEDML